MTKMSSSLPQLPEMRGNSRGKHSRWGKSGLSLNRRCQDDFARAAHRAKWGSSRRLKRWSRVQRNATVNIGEEGRPSDWRAVCGESRMYGSEGAAWKSIQPTMNTHCVATLPKGSGVSLTSRAPHHLL